jgi:hypothetical protein
MVLEPAVLEQPHGLGAQVGGRRVWGCRVAQGIFGPDGSRAIFRRYRASG